MQWLRDGLGIIKTSAEVERLAASVPDNGGVYLVPAFVGLGAPHWDAYARGAIVGLTRGSTAAHIARAALEGIAFQVTDVLTAMEADSGIKVAELRVDGGACANNLLMQTPGRSPGCAGRPSERIQRRPQWVRRTWQAWLSVFTNRRTRSPRNGVPTVPSNQRSAATSAKNCVRAGTRHSTEPKPGYRQL